ncbi:MAG TPA: ABC transporter permease [Gemmatimonadaceae bacterium]|nr:ABC transporter permease [Gemmatimonadaceae bacterium]
MLTDVLVQVGRDVRQAWRAILRMPGLAAVVIGSLAIGIGVNTTIFSWVQAVVLRPIPGVRDASAFKLVEPRSEAGSQPGVSWPEYRDLGEQLRSFRELAAYASTPLTVGDAGRTERSYGQLVSGNYFSALGLRPALGRLLRPDDASRAGGEPVVVVSHGYWQSRLAGAPDALGRTLRVNGRDLTIVGVAPAGFQGTVLGLYFDLWVPATMSPVLTGNARSLESHGVRGYSVTGRLRPGASLAGAQAELDAAMAELARRYPESNAGMRGEVLPFWGAPRGPQRFLVRGLAVLQGLMLLLLLAVCANTANLLLARATARQREIGVRRALGAGRWRVVSLLLAESLTMALVAAALGALLAVWGTTALRAVPWPGGLPIRFQTSLDGVSLLVAAGLGLASGLVFGLAPALQLARVDPQLALRAGARSSGRSALRSALVGTEVALAMMVLVVAAIFFRNLRETQGTDTGFRRDGVLLVAYDLGGRGTPAAANREFTRRLLERVRALPGVEAAAIAVSVPLDVHGMPTRAFTLEGHARDAAGSDQALVNTVTPGYFAMMGIPLRAGADLVDLGDTTAAPDAVVNEEFVRRFLGGAEAVGRRLQLGAREYVIRGVARNSLYDSFGESPKPMMYLSYRVGSANFGQVHLRTRPGAETALAPEVRRLVRELDPVVPAYDVRTLNEHVDKNLVFRKIPARMFVVLGPMLLALAAVGIYAVVAYAVARRTAEIGVRLALGATARRVVAQIVRESLRVVGIGALVGWVLAYLVYIHAERGKGFDAPVLLGVPAVLMLVAAVASWIPALRAAAVDPVEAMRPE